MLRKNIFPLSILVEGKISKNNLYPSYVKNKLLYEGIIHYSLGQEEGKSSLDQ